MSNEPLPNQQIQAKLDRKKQALRDNLRRRKSQIRELSKESADKEDNGPQVRKADFKAKEF